MTEPAAGVGAADIRVDHHMFYLAEPEEAIKAAPPVDAANGLVCSRPGMAVIFTGVSSGFAKCSVQTYRTPPPLTNTAAWDEVVDHSVEAPVGALYVSPLMSHRPDLPTITPFGPGTYRLRVHARGRDTNPDGVAHQALEDYLIISWPASPQPDEVHRHSDHYGAQRRRSAASIPPRQPGHWPYTPDQQQQAQADNLRRMRERHKKQPPR